VPGDDEYRALVRHSFSAKGRDMEHNCEATWYHVMTRNKHPTRTCTGCLGQLILASRTFHSFAEQLLIRKA
jgi:hypothetical protein